MAKARRTSRVRARAPGASEAWTLDHLVHPLVRLALVCDGHGRLVRVVLGGEAARARAFARRWRATLAPGAGRGPHLEQIGAYLDGHLRTFDLPLRMLGTDFQRRAWRALLQIPYGACWTYGQQARAMGAPRAVRAVGQANGANPLPLVVPCHRVVGAGGGLGGFAAGLDLKRALLDLEARAAGSP